MYLHASDVVDRQPMIACLSKPHSDSALGVAYSKFQAMHMKSLRPIDVYYKAIRSGISYSIPAIESKLSQPVYKPPLGTDIPTKNLQQEPPIHIELRSILNSDPSRTPTPTANPVQTPR